MNEISSDETTDEEEVNRNFETQAQLIVETATLPKKSAERYMLVYETYRKWKQKNRNALSQSEESNLIVYFKDLSARLNPSTLWSAYSMLKSTLNTRDNIDVNKFYKLKSLLKNNAKGHKPKKSAVFTWDEVIKFINDAPDDVHLAHKVVLIFGISGATRCEELKELKVADIEDLGNKYLVSINDSKNNLPRRFLIGDLFYERVKKYISLKPSDFHTERFLIQFHKGKCQRQVIGRNTIGLIPRTIARYLKLNNPDRYTGHCLRRTSATLLSNSGANTTMLKQLGGWKSASIAEGYVENSLTNRENIFKSITHAAKSNAQPNPQPSTSGTSTATSINTDKSEGSIGKDVDYDNFSEDFELDADTLAAIEKSIVSKELKSPMPSFATGNHKKLTVAPNHQVTRPTHFLKKTPICVFSRGKENEPPLKKHKGPEKKIETNNQATESKSTNIETNNRTSESPPTNIEATNQTSESTSTNSVTSKILSIKYDNCVFHGNIINNFYYSKCDSETNEEKV